MKYMFMLSIFLHCTIGLLAQKKSLPVTAINDWPIIMNEKISPDGKFITYVLNKYNSGYKVFIKAIDAFYKREFVGANEAVITADNRFVIIKYVNDSIGIVEPASGRLNIIEKVTSYKIPTDGNGKWLAYKTGDNLVLHDLFSGSEKKYTSVNDYFFSKDGTALVFQTEIKNEKDTIYEILWNNLATGNSFSVLKGRHFSSGFTFDAAATQLAFIVEKTNVEKNYNSLYYYNKGTSAAILRVDENTQGMTKDMAIAEGSEIFFSPNGKRIFFKLKKIKTLSDRNGIEIPEVNVWNYLDEHPMSQQIKDYKNGWQNYTAVISENSNNIIQIETKDTQFGFLKLSANGDGDYAMHIRDCDFLQAHWRKKSRPNIQLVSLKEGTRKDIIEDQIIDIGDSFSPNGNYLYWYDRKLRNYFSYHIPTQQIKNLTKTISRYLPCDENTEPGAGITFGDIGWLKSGKAFLIYDKYDIWKIDPQGLVPPVCVTGGYGRKNNIIFRVTSTIEYSAVETFSDNQTVILSAFDRNNKYNGFFSVNLSKPKTLEKLVMSANIYYYDFYFPGTKQNIDVPYRFLLKAKNADVFLTQRCSTNEFTNLYATKDFKHFTKLTKEEPQKQYNWVTTELVRWKRFDNTLGEGILYKPENFNPKNKYPIIFYFYEENSNAIHSYPKVENLGGPMNIPFFVSNGYIVFVPDIKYKLGAIGESAYNSVVSAAKFFSKMPWIDSTKIGIQGHSFGGYQVNYIVTRTNMFAAAMSAAGLSNLISFYGSIRKDWGNAGGQYLSESGQIRMGGNLWQAQEQYTKNSPIFQAHKIKTPILLMQCEDDGAVPMAQGIEFFLALRRLNKKVWMLEYDGGGHSVNGLTNLFDYDNRMLQFFDHYLRNKPAPIWMTKGIPAELKGTELGLELDKNN